ncbi:MAG TPA: branched-chain-amino-acid transaminase [bacterium]|nr:branched-chain-amino-acid transaminase [bacterium]
MLIYLNGKLVQEEDAKISVFDHGLLYGDGIFEGIRIYNGKIFKLDEHIERLYNSAKAIMLEVPLNFYDMKNATIQTVRANELQDGYIRLIVTRGVGDLGLNPLKCKVPTLIIIANKVALYPESLYEKGLDVITASTRRNLSESVNPAIKSLNYLNNILAKIEANNSGFPEALLLNQEGFVSECTGENIFAVKNRMVMTPPVSAGVLDGITRNAIKELCSRLKLEFREINLTRYDIFNADEAFLSGTAAEIVPVVSLDRRIIGSGKPGEITKSIGREFRLLTHTDGVPVYE